MTDQGKDPLDRIDARMLDIIDDLKVLCEEIEHYQRQEREPLDYQAKWCKSCAHDALSNLCGAHMWMQRWRHET